MAEIKNTEGRGSLNRYQDNLFIKKAPGKVCVYYAVLHTQKKGLQEGRRVAVLACKRNTGSVSLKLLRMSPTGGGWARGAGEGNGVEEMGEQHLSTSLCISPCADWTSRSKLTFH